MLEERSTTAHKVSVEVDVPADGAFRFMSDAQALGRWALGCLDLKPDGAEGVYRGTSIFDGSPSWLHIEGGADRCTVDYHIGTIEHRRPRIRAVVTEQAGASVITLLASREPDMDDARWEKLCRSHALEILIIAAHCPRWVAGGTQ